MRKMRIADCGTRNGIRKFRPLRAVHSAIRIPHFLKRDPAAAEFRLASRRTDLTEALIEEALKTSGIVASAEIRKGLINLLPDCLVVVIGKLQGFRGVCYLPGYVCREGSTPVASMLNGRLVNLQRKLAPADKRIRPEQAAAPNRAEVGGSAKQNQSLVPAHQAKTAQDHERQQEQDESGQQPKQADWWGSSIRFRIG
jgi:hypothetical protein